MSFWRPQNQKFKVGLLPPKRIVLYESIKGLEK